MKKIKELIKPYLCIIFGALFLLLLADYLDGSGVYLAFGIIGAIFAVAYIAIGIILVMKGDSLKDSNKDLLKLCAVVLYPIHLFAITLVNVIDNGSNFGTRLLMVNIFILLSTLILVGYYLGTKLAKKDLGNNFGFIVNTVFLAVMFSSLLFANAETPILTITIGFLINIAFFIIFAFILFNNSAKAEKAPAKEEKKVEAKSKAPKESKPSDKPEEAKEAE